MNAAAAIADASDPWTLSAYEKTWGLGLRQVVQHPFVGVGYGNDTFLKVKEPSQSKSWGVMPG